MFVIIIYVLLRNELGLIYFYYSFVILYILGNQLSLQFNLIFFYFL
jgi:hypothetical protein